MLASVMKHFALKEGLGPPTSRVYYEHFVLPGLSLLLQHSEAGFDQSLRIVMIENACPCLFLKRFDEPLNFIRNSAAASQTTNDFSFIVRNRKFVERANRAGNEHHDIA